MNPQSTETTLMSMDLNDIHNDTSIIMGKSSASQPTSLLSSGSSSSIGSTSSVIRREDKLFDQIEDLICEYMRESDRHYLHCRVLRWGLDDQDLPRRQFSAVIVINPPVTISK